MRSTAGRNLYLYWNGVRAGRMAPHRYEIEPARFSDHLPDTFILEKSGPGLFQFRLAGTRIGTAFQTELRGKNFLELFLKRERDAVLDDIENLTRYGAVAQLTLATTTTAFTAIANDEQNTEAQQVIEGPTFECVLMPLLHGGQQVDRLLGTLAPINGFDWPESMALNPDRLISRELVWPEGRPQVLRQAPHHQRPFSPEIRHSRIVRADRRQFRVYDGGLAGTARDDSRAKS